MTRSLLHPRWVALHLILLAVIVVFVNLGLWQLRRLDERRLNNDVLGARIADDPAPLDVLVTAAGGDVESLEYRRVTAQGTFDPAHEVLIRSRVHNGQPGYGVLTPLMIPDDGVVLVDRGWIPFEYDIVPVSVGPAPPGETAVVGVIRLTQVRGAIGPVDPPGELTAFARVDIGRIAEQMPYAVAPVWIQQVGPGDTLPIPGDVPDFADNGPHLSYAIQWFSFAVIAAVGYVALVRKSRRRPRA